MIIFSPQLIGTYLFVIMTVYYISDKQFAFEEDSFYLKGLGFSIRRADVARYMIKIMEEDLHHKKIVAIAVK